MNPMGDVLASIQSLLSARLNRITDGFEHGPNNTPPLPATQASPPRRRGDSLEAEKGCACFRSIFTFRTVEQN
ncbi:MAG: hypothetical protein OEV94_09795, partial [Deltaproteobacteria bacterium]|nr:hypothetical protein [Deltaproteobacteria bacterium]